MKFKLILVILAFLSAYNMKAECSFKPKYIIQIEENTKAVMAYEIQVMRISKEHPTSLGFHEGLKAVEDLCNGTWIIKSNNTYMSYSEATNGLNYWKNLGYKDAFIKAVYLYVNKDDKQSNKVPVNSKKSNTSANKKKEVKRDIINTNVQIDSTRVDTTQDVVIDTEKTNQTPTVLNEDKQIPSTNKKQESPFDDSKQKEFNHWFPTKEDTTKFI